MHVLIVLSDPPRILLAHTTADGQCRWAICGDDEESTFTACTGMLLYVSVLTDEIVTYKCCSCCRSGKTFCL